MDDVETRIVRTMAEAVFVLLAENFDVFVVEGESAIALEQATNARQHFPSLRIVCLAPKPHDSELVMDAQQQKITHRFDRTRANGICAASAQHSSARSDASRGYPAEGIDPCHSLIGNLNQFSAAEILQMSCLGQRSGRFTFKSARGNSEIYLHHGLDPARCLWNLGRRSGRRGNFPVAPGSILF